MPATEHFFRDQKKMHLIFAISCFVLLVSVIWMMVQDYSDEWYAYQATNFELQAEAKERDIAEMKSDAFLAQLKATDAELAEIEAGLDSLAAEHEQVESHRDRATRLVDALKVRLKSEGALRDEASAKHGLAIRDNLSADRTHELMEKFNEAQALCDATQLELEDAQAALAQVGKVPPPESGIEQARLDDLQALLAQKTETVKQKDKLQADVLLAVAALDNIKPETALKKFKRWTMTWPILEGFNGHFKPTQDWMPDLEQTLGMTAIARFDRCRTCHMNMDRTAAGNLPAFPHGHPSDDSDVRVWVKENKFPHPYTTHPEHELFVTAASPHPVSKFGCTSCHDGQGSGTSFGNAEHTPNDPHQAAHWEDDYHYHPNHFWEYPMQPDRFQESTCIKCHHQVVELGTHPKFGASAPKVTKGFNLIRKYGCFGCHEIHGFDGGEAIGPDMRLEPQTAAQAQRVAEDSKQVAGKFRKVGPSLRHIAAKSTKDFIAYWTEVPKRFRASTKMPQFFNLSNQTDEMAQAYEAVELAGIAKVLIDGSEPIDLLEPAEDYQPNVERGQQLFSERGCLACHQHDAVPGTTADFGPNISDIHRKVKRNADDSSFSDFLYTWVKEPTRYHKRTKMPNLYLDPYTSGEEEIDPAADIVAFLLSRGELEEYPVAVAEEQAIDDLVTLFLKKARFSDVAVKAMLASRSFPQAATDIAGDERVLAGADANTVFSDEEWRERKLEYVGRRTISRYGCYGCHDIPGYEDSRPIGVALQDWGRKDTSKLGLEHIEEFLHHHGEVDPAQWDDAEGESTRDRVVQAIKDADSGVERTDELEQELTQAYFYDSLLHHGRPGFIWQKLRGPRTYDYMKTETKGYADRLRMPKFPLKEDEVEAIATFVLGLVAEPPAEQYVYTPDVRDHNRIEGEFLLAKYNCTGCHMVEMPKVTFGVDLEEDIFPTDVSGFHDDAIALLKQFKQPKAALTGDSQTFLIDGEEMELPLASFHGIRMVDPDPEETEADYRETGFDTVEMLRFGDGEDAPLVFPSSRMTITDSKMVDVTPARGGDFAEWLVPQLSKTLTGGNRSLAWQAAPPPLFQEGQKVQTPWLYQFLLEPEKLRYTTVLRMPRFNMSPEEAQTLANYFAAVDGAAFPYQEQGPADPDYIAQQQASLEEEGLLAADQDYLGECWKSLNGPLCIKCHSLGSRKFKVSDPKKDIQGPNLNRVQRRLRSDWVKLWLYNPKWVTPYTSMPVNFPNNNRTQFPDLFDGDPNAQVIGTRDALLNYGRLLEDVGPAVYAPPGKAAPADQADADENEAAAVLPSTGIGPQASTGSARQTLRSDSFTTPQ